MKRKYMFIFVFAIILNVIIMLFGKSPFPNLFTGEVFTFSVSNIIWCVLFDILLVFFGVKSHVIFDMPYETIQNYRLVLSLAKNDFKVRFVGSYLGVFWAFINPVVTILLYWIVFQFAFKSPDVDGYPFVLWLVAGLVPWLLIQESIINGTNALLEYSYLVKKVLFKISILPSIKILSAAFIHLMFMIVVMSIYMLMGYYPTLLYFIQLLYYFICTLAFTLAIVYVTCSVVLFIRDLSQFISVFMQVFMWASPILWRIDIIPESLQWVVKLNPAYYIINGYRDSLLFKVSVFEHMAHTFYFWGIVIILFIIGSSVFSKLRPHFADVL